MAYFRVFCKVRIIREALRKVRFSCSFEEKKTMKNGFEDSGIRMNTYIAKKEKWTLTELEERNQYLMGRALEIWLTPSMTLTKPI